MTSKGPKVETGSAASALPPDSDGREEEGMAPLDDVVVALLVDNQRQFLGYLERHLPTRADAEDVLQEFHLRVIGKVGQIREQASIRWWLFRVLKSVLADHFRKKAAAKRQASGLPADALGPLPEDDVVEGIICDCMHGLLGALKPGYAEVIRRADILEEAPAEIAADLGTTAGNIRTRLHRARRALGQSLRLSCLSCATHGFLNCCCKEPKALREGAGAPAPLPQV